MDSEPETLDIHFDTELNKNGDDGFELTNFSFRFMDEDNHTNVYVVENILYNVPSIDIIIE